MAVTTNHHINDGVNTYMLSFAIISLLKGKLAAIYLYFDFNPYKPSVLFVGYWQTVQNQIRRRNTQL